MNDAKKCGNSSPKLTANFISKLCFWWLKDLFWYGRTHNIQAADLHEALPEEFSEPLTNVLEQSWKRELDEARAKKRRPSLWSAIIRTYRWSYLSYAVLIAIYMVTTLLMPLALEQLMLDIELTFTGTTTTGSVSSSSSRAYLYAAGMLGLQILQTVAMCHGHIGLERVGMRARIACSSLMFRKMIRLPISSASGSTGRAIINLLSYDVRRFENLAHFSPFIALATIELIITTYLLWRYVGVVAFVGVFLMILQTLPLQALCYSVQSKLRLKLTAIMDQRILLVAEVINGIRTIKMFVWEKYFEKLVYIFRRREIKVYTIISFLTATLTAFMNFSNRLAGFFTILVYTLQNGSISSITILSLSQYFTNLALSMSVYFTNAVTSFADVNVSIKRIEDFLLLDEVESIVKLIGSENYPISIAIKEVTASWKEESNNKTLQDIKLDVSPNKLYLIVGSVGSGKSSLLKLILGELRPIIGEVLVRGRVSYSSQEPWLFTASIRDNIIFGEKFDEDKYRRVTKACALLEDFSQLPYGDKTLVGERGANLSGGQCARVNMARAVYRDADIYLFDDPLSAVDTRVAKSLFEECINGFLKEKTRILVTHHFQHLKIADAIILLNHGKIEFQGTYSDFQKNEKYISHLPSNSKTETSTADKNDTSENDKLKVMANISEIDEVEKNVPLGVPKGTEEFLAKGFVPPSLYWKYIRAGGSYATLLFLTSCFILSILSISAFDYWLVEWSNQVQIGFRNIDHAINITYDINSQPMDFSYTEMSLCICGGLVAAVIISAVVKNLLSYKVMLNASEKLHNKMFDRLMKTPLRFFEVNPAGRILNRFSKDTGAIDDTLPNAMFEAVDTILLCIALIIPVWIINWLYIFPTLVAVCVYFKISKLYVSTAQDVKRLESNAKSPVLSLAASSLAGLLTIRSSGSQDLVARAFDSRQDEHSAAYYLTLVTGMAFTFWLELATYVLWAFVAYTSLALRSAETFASEIGLALVQLNYVGLTLQYAIRHVSETVNQMTSAERIIQYTELQREEESESEVETRPKDWPDRGEVRFDRLCLRYTEEEDAVLKNLNFKVESGMKVGIVGRTGAGKTSLIAALFRFAKIDGSLLIDGIDTKKISLSDLRSRISIIPQEPILFSATLRHNLDPVHEFDDASLWSALESVELNRTFESLDCTIDRGGGNLSSGQRQLLCLARAIVKRNKILVLDEATANVDPATDDLIQKTIRIAFKDCTVLTIAHRLNTIMDSDRVLVMDHGEVVEFDHPHCLLKRKDSYFSKMVHQTGNAMSEDLKMIAEQTFYEDLTITTRL